MKLFRVFYWAVMAGALLYGLYSGSRFSWLLFLAMALLLTAALGLNLWTVCSFSYLQELSAAQGEKGQAVSLRLGIYNDKPFPFTHMRVYVDAPDPADRQALAVDLAPRDSCSFTLRLGLPRRGEYAVGMSRVELEDVFGLLPMGFDLCRLPYYRQKSLLVLPRAHEISLPGGGAGAYALAAAASAPGEEEFSHLRGWLPGDRLSRVHWPASAKTRSLFARQYQAPAGGCAVIFLDCQTLAPEPADLLAECAATLAYAHLGRGEPVELLCSRPGTPAPGRAFSLGELPRLREWLALLDFDQPNPCPAALAQALEGGDRSAAYVLGGRYEPAYLAAGLDSLDWRYWTTEPLPPGIGTGSSRRAAAIAGKDIAAFLAGELEGSA